MQSPLPRVAGVSFVFALLTLAGCSGLSRPGGLLRPAVASLAARPAARVPVQVSVIALQSPKAPCSNTFLEQTLPYTTTAGADTLYDTNGTGLAIDDLDGDGKPEIVFANLKGPNTILWNLGNFQFRKEELPYGDSRAVAIVDVNGDGLPDIVFTRRTMGPSYWRNTGQGAGLARFVEEALPGVDEKLYAMNWSDLRGNGTLDLVGGSYDAALEKDLGYSFMRLRSGGGVYYYQNNGGSLMAQQLAPLAQTLAVAFPDFDGDGRPDILIGNDFSMLDQAWRQTQSGWQATYPFEQMTHSTMSFDLGDIDNDGQPELFATDMKPYDQSVTTLAQWRPMMTKMPLDTFAGDPQIMENVLQVRDRTGRFRNEAYARGLDATGWSWSAKFGDLDNDGRLDLYVANGMLDDNLFSYLPNHELVEENRAFHNEGRRNFKLAPQWGLGSRRSGRGMSMADLDGDGKLDIVVNNFETPAQLFENRLCGGQSLEVDLFWPASKNTRAIGARLALRTSAGAYYRDVRAMSGYLSGDPARVHFGFPADAQLESLEIRWPDGKSAVINAPTAHTLLTITR